MPRRVTPMPRDRFDRLLLRCLPAYRAPHPGTAAGGEPAGQSSPIGSSSAEVRRAWPMDGGRGSSELTRASTRPSAPHQVPQCRLAHEAAARGLFTAGLVGAGLGGDVAELKRLSMGSNDSRGYRVLSVGISNLPGESATSRQPMTQVRIVAMGVPRSQCLILDRHQAQQLAAFLNKPDALGPDEIVLMPSDSSE